MKTKSLITFLAGFLLAGSVKALSPVYTADLINTAVCVDTAPAVDLNASNVGYISFQTIYSSAAYSASTFTDGRSSTASITVAVNDNFTSRAATNSITIAATASLAPAKATDQITLVSTTSLSGTILTVNGINIVAGKDYAITTPTGTTVALKNIVTNITGIDAAVADLVIYATATQNGLIGNTYSMSSSSPALLTVASAHFTGGRENALLNSILTINGSAYRNGYLWTSQDANGVDNSTMAATSIASLIGHITGLKAQAVSSVVYTTATTAGSAGNAFTLASSTPTVMTVASANYTGGRDTATVTINGVVLKNGVSWATGATSSDTAKNISDAIMASSSLNTIIRSTWSDAGVVTATATASGTGGNYSLATNNATSLTLSASAFAGGSNINWVVNTPTITITNHGYSLGLSVLYSTGAVAITGLTNQTTYYVTPITANTIKLSSSKANVAAGTYIVLASSVADGQHTYTLTPIALSGSPAWKWQESNDGTNFSDINVSSVTFASPYTTASTFWDFGNVNAKYMRLNVTSGSFGCVNLRAKGNGKSAP